MEVGGDSVPGKKNVQRPCAQKGMVDLELEAGQCGWSIEHEEESYVSWRCKFAQDLTGSFRPHK